MRLCATIKETMKNLTFFYFPNKRKLENLSVQGLASVYECARRTIRAITSLAWMLRCQRSVIIKVLDPPISNENRAHWGMNPSKWSINYETFPSHKGRKLLASLVPGSTKKCHVSQGFLTVTEVMGFQTIIIIIK